MTTTAAQLFLCSALLLPAFAQDQPRVIPLWPNGAPGFESRRNEPEIAKDYYIRNINNPSITASCRRRRRLTGRPS